MIVGRCADFILKDDDVDILSVFITAPLADRITREMDVDDMNETQAKKFIRKMDMRRKNYYNYFTKGDWGKKNTYDLILNSSGTLWGNEKLFIKLIRSRKHKMYNNFRYGKFELVTSFCMR